MKAGFQSQGLSFWDHGELVAARFRDLMGPKNMIWRLPTWFTENEEVIKNSLLPQFEPISTYMLWHDCGKPASRTLDENGKPHYPNHAEISSKLWLELGGDPFIGELIRRDMECHLLRPADALEFSKTPHALVLLTAALCELHANASMFGGLDSDSFKIKYKRLDKCGKIILNSLKETNHV